MKKEEVEGFRYKVFENEDGKRKESVKNQTNKRNLQ